jgi:D-inositol-3-phosphate glycosyltransferase
VRAHGLTGQVAFMPYVRDRERLARMFAEASCVVVPGAAETFGLVALEAAACAAPVVCCENAPVAAVLGGLAETFAPGDAKGLKAAILRARARPSDRVAAAGLVAGYAWERVLADELRDLDALVS